MLDMAQYIISNIAVAGLLAFVAWLVGRSDRNSSLAHLLWVSVFLKLITPAVAVLEVPVPAGWCPEMLTVDKATANETPPSLDRQSSHDHRRANTAEKTASGWTVGLILKQYWTHFLAAVWLVGFLFVVIRGGRQFLKLQALIRNEGEVDEEATEFIGKLVRQHFQSTAAGKTGPPVVRLPIRISPMLFGAGKKTVVVCPEILWHSFTPEERQAFLAHEAAHFCRRDHWVRWIEWLASAVYWWFPPLHVARRQLERHEEVCCDLWAVEQLKSSRRSYAEALLKAVDFMSTQRGAIPRLASSMQATENLEHRLRRVMLPEQHVTSSPQVWMIGSLAASCLLLHPQIKPILETAGSALSSTPTVAIAPVADVSSSPDAADSDSRLLPPEPQGFWNNVPPSQWASFSLSLESATVTADTNRGLRIQTPGNEDLYFEHHELTSMVCLPSPKRILVGAADGSLRIWDLEVAQPVSLVGKHPEAIVSLDYHARCGLVSADANGVIVRWNVQSGERIASYHSEAEIAAIRVSSDGSRLAVLTGPWHSPGTQSMEILDAQSFERITSNNLSLPTAIMIPTADQNWLLVDWAGNVRSPGSERLIARIPKMHVSALVFASSLSRQDDDTPSFSIPIPQARKDQ